jgi:hypothetical protein
MTKLLCASPREIVKSLSTVNSGQPYPGTKLHHSSATPAHQGANTCHATMRRPSKNHLEFPTGGAYRLILEHP